MTAVKSQSFFLDKLVKTNYNAICEIQKPKETE